MSQNYLSFCRNSRQDRPIHLQVSVKFQNAGCAKWGSFSSLCFSCRWGFLFISMTVKQQVGKQARDKCLQFKFHTFILLSTHLLASQAGFSFSCNSPVEKDASWAQCNHSPYKYCPEHLWFYKFFKKINPALKTQMHKRIQLHSRGCQAAPPL